MVKKPEPPSKGVWLGEVEAADETGAFEKAAAEFKVPVNRLMAIRAFPSRMRPYAGDAAAHGLVGDARAR